MKRRWQRLDRAAIVTGVAIGLCFAVAYRYAAELGGAEGFLIVIATAALCLAMLTRFESRSTTEHQQRLEELVTLLLEATERIEARDLAAEAVPRRVLGDRPLGTDTLPSSSPGDPRDEQHQRDDERHEVEHPTTVAGEEQ
jgi:hypothetical protein